MEDIMIVWCQIIPNYRPKSICDVSFKMQTFIAITVLVKGPSEGHRGQYLLSNLNQLTNIDPYIYLSWM